jgi:cell division protein FtsB
VNCKVSSSFRLEEARRATLLAGAAHQGYTGVANQDDEQAAEEIATLQQEQEALTAQNDMLNTGAMMLTVRSERQW